MRKRILAVQTFFSIICLMLVKYTSRLAKPPDLGVASTFWVSWSSSWGVGGQKHGRSRSRSRSRSRISHLADGSYKPAHTLETLLVRLPQQLLDTSVHDPAGQHLDPVQLPDELDVAQTTPPQLRLLLVELRRDQLPLLLCRGLEGGQGQTKTKSQGSRELREQSGEQGAMKIKERSKGST